MKVSACPSSKQSRAEPSQTTFASVVKSSLPLPLFFFSFLSFLKTTFPRPPRQPPPSSHPLCSSFLSALPIERLPDVFAVPLQAFLGNIHFTTPFQLGILCSRLRSRPQPRFDLDLTSAFNFCRCHLSTPFSFATICATPFQLPLYSTWRLRRLFHRPFGRERLAFPAWKRDTFLQPKTHNRSRWDEERSRSRRSRMTEIALCK